MTAPTAAVRPGRAAAAGRLQELPRVAVVAEHQLEHAVVVAVARFAVGPRAQERRRKGAAGADHELAHAALVVAPAIGVLRRKALVQMIVAGQDDDHAAICELIFNRMERTFAWRLEQIRRGMIELRTARTAAELESFYEEEPMFDLLEMKTKDASWDDYRGLIG